MDGYHFVHSCSTCEYIIISDWKLTSGVYCSYTVGRNVFFMNATEIEENLPKAQYHAICSNYCISKQLRHRKDIY
jgi:hypothetical protein